MAADDDLRQAFLTRDLSDAQRADLLAAGEEVHFGAGDVVFVEGEPADHLWILLEGEIELSRQTSTGAAVVAIMSTPGQWAGGLRAWGDAANSAGYRATGHGVGEGRALLVPSEELSRLLGEWLPFGKHIIVGIYQTVRGIEATAREREHLVSLGTMAAGLAHEINNPAAASLRAVAGLRTACDTMLSSLTDLARLTITAEQFVALDTLRTEAAAAVPPAAGALEISDREEAIGQWMAKRGVPQAWQLAPVLAAAGVDQDWCEHVEKAVGAPALGPALQWASTTLNAGTLLTEMQDTTTRISHLIDSVRSYTQMDRASLQRVDLHDGIESTLVMLTHKLRGVEVERDFATGLPEIDVYAGELNQVWTNLIDNAVDAMEGRGSLRIATRQDGSDMIVDISDTGHGMPRGVHARAFEPFFTTKEVGKGTGLGLDISRRIVVDHHGGDISFDSSPDGTTVHVRIPVSR